MTSPLDKLGSQEIFELIVGQPVDLEFEPIDTPEEIRTSETLGGPITVQEGVAIAQHLKGVKDDTGQGIDRPGIILKVSSVNGVKKSLYYRNWNARDIDILKPYIKNGLIFKRVWLLLKPGSGPRFQTQITPRAKAKA